MQNNILRDSNLTSIYIVYKDSVRHKYSVKLRFIDTKECYLTTSMEQNFVKPKRNTPAELIAYTTDGVYKSEIKITDITVSLNEIVFVINLPERWNFSQLRNSTRKQYELPFSIKFNDGYEISDKTYDISVGGISFMPDKPIPSIYTKVNGNLKFVLPSGSAYILEKNEITTDVKFLRTVVSEYPVGTYYVYKFLNLSSEDADKIKSFLIYLN